MKKIICILLSMFIMGSVSFAQDKDAKKPAKSGKTKSANTKMAAEPKQVMPAKQAAPAVTPDAAPAAKGGKKMKKDGTPDMRTKENKAAAKKSAGPLKKDGTPDMRYKANKDAAAAKK